MAHLYKNRLQNYALKRHLPFPTYATETQGPPHARLFKSQVTIDGITYAGPDFSSTLKEAEHAAAKVAFLAVSADAPQEDNCLHKSMLQELVQKKGLVLPIYATNKTGPPHMPCFVSTVQISGGRYVGEEARTKKQAELNAAKVAYMALTEGGPGASNTTAFSNSVATSSSNPSNLQTVMPHKTEPSIIIKTETTTTNAVGTSVPNDPEKANGGPGANNVTAIPNIVRTAVSGSSSLQKVINPENEPTVNSSVGYSIPDAPEKAKGYFVLKDLQDAIEKSTSTLPPVMVHQAQPISTPNVVELSKPVINQDNCLHKRLLHELAQKKGIVLPVYTTNKSGPPHMPRFVSTVQISGGSYVGEEARTKKQAEMNAAKVAYIALTEGGPRASNPTAVSNNVATSSSTPSNPQTVMPQKTEPASTITTTTNGVITPKIEPTINNSVSYSIPDDPEKAKGYLELKDLQDAIDNSTITMPPVTIHQAQPISSPNVVELSKPSVEPENHVIQAGGEGSSSNGKTIQPFVKEAAAREQQTRILIRPHVEGMTYDGPIQVSDNEWVAMEVPVLGGM